MRNLKSIVDILKSELADILKNELAPEATQQHTVYCIWSVVSSFIWDHIHMGPHSYGITFIWDLIHIDVQPIVFGVSFLQSQISISDLVL